MTHATHSVPDVSARYGAEVVQEFYALGYWRDSTLIDVFERWAVDHPDRILVTDGQIELTWRDVHERAYALADWLRAQGVHPSDRVVVQMPNWSEFAVIVVAIARLGAVIVPAQPIYRHNELRHIINDSAAKVVFFPERFRGFDHDEMIRDLRADCPSIAFSIAVRGESRAGRHDAFAFEDIAELKAESLDEVNDRLGAPARPDEGYAIVYSSGTTAKPKGCWHTWNTLAFTARAMISSWKLEPDDVAFVPSPVGHGTGMICGVLLPMLTGGATHLLDHWQPAEAIARIRKYSCTYTVTATAFLKMLLDEHDARTENVASMRLWVAAGSPIPPEIVLRANEALPSCRIISLYGRSENFTATMCRIDDPAERSISSDGRALDGVECVVVDDAGNVLAAGEAGDVSYRGPGHMITYLNRELETQNMFTEDGYSRSGDLGRIDAEGYLRITGRLSDMIVRGGMNISAREIEDLLLAHPDVDDVAAVAMPDDRLGEKVCIFVVPGAGAAPTLASLTSYLRDDCHMAIPKLPERLELVDDLPTNAVGKTVKAVLRKDIQERLAAERA